MPFPTSRVFPKAHSRAGLGKWRNLFSPIRICREQLLLSSHDHHVEPHARCVQGSVGHGVHPCPRIFDAASSALWLVEDRNFNFSRANRRHCETTPPVTEIAAKRALHMALKSSSIRHDWCSPFADNLVNKFPDNGGGSEASRRCGV